MRSERTSASWVVVALVAAVAAVTGGQSQPVGAESSDAVPDMRMNAAAITTSAGTTCAIITGGDVTCWGSDLSGKLGNGPASVGNITAPDIPVGLPGERTAIEVAAGESHTCALLDDRSVTCWGNDNDGQLGNGSAGFADTPPPSIAMPGGVGVAAISTGDRHTCALLVDGEITCWGRDDGGQLGNGSLSGDVEAPPAPVVLPPGRTATAVTAGSSHTCALLDNGDIACWGEDSSGQIGNGAPTTDATSPTLIPLPNNRTATAISAGRAHTCALLDNGAVSCWGEDDFGQLGNGAATGDVTEPPAPVALPGGGSAIAVSAGGWHTCVLLGSGDISCWGLNNDGELGIGSKGGVEIIPQSPVALPGGRRAIAVSAGSLYTCALYDDFGMGCWGDDGAGRLGNGVATDDVTSPPGPVTFPYPGVGSLAVGRTTCAIDQKGNLYCWGKNQLGQVGNGFLGDDVDIPTLIESGASPVVDVAVGRGHTCLVNEAGEVRCWGNDELGALGNGPEVNDWSVPGPPVDLPAGAAAVAVSAGAFHTCALLDSAQVSCWGSDASGQLGNGPGGGSGSPQTPLSFPGSQGARAVFAGDAHTCAVLNNNTLTCWGENEYGQLGDGGTRTVNQAPGSAITLPFDDARSGSAGSGHTCAVEDLGRVSCWGRSQDSQVGVGSFDEQIPTPVDPIALPPGSRAKNVQLGSRHSCALLFGGDVSCWGNDWSGQIGNGGVVQLNYSSMPSSPIDFPGGLAAVEVAAGYDTSCAVLSSGEVACWGSDSNGQLGNGAFTDDVSAPQLIGLDLGDGAQVEPQSTPLAPSAPRSVALTSQDAALDVDWRAPSSDGGSIVLGYTATAQPGGRTCTTNGAIGCTITGLTNGTKYSIRVTANNAVGTSPPSSPATATPTAPTPVPPADAVTPTDPARYWDTRDSPTFDRAFESTGRLPAGTFQKISIAGRGAVPDDATGIVGNLTVITPDAPGFGVIYPCTPRLPVASTVNYVPGDIVANNTIVPLDANGDVCVFTQSTADYALDINGFLPAESPLVGLDPARYLETRAGEPTFDDESQGIGRVDAAGVVEVQIAGRGSVPEDAVAAIVNATIINPDGGAFATLYPCGPRPTASNINYDAGSITPNGAVVQLSDTGTVCIYTHAAADMILDVSGYVPPGVDSISTTIPMRFVETRAGEPTVDGQFRGIGRTDAGETLEVPVAGRSGVPDDATAAIVNIAVIGPEADGFATLYPCGELPFTSNLNYTTGAIRANNAVTRLSPDGTLCIYTRDASDVILDIAGWLR